jgi:DUF4097 and DUF4098 domain-containing protein YvlB
LVPAAGAAPTQDRGRSRSGGVIEGQSIDTTFRMEKGGLVDLQALSGTIIVTGASGSDVRIRASAEQGGVRLRASSTLATLRTVSDRGRMRDVRYEVAVPAGIRVLMNTTSGDLSASNLRGDLEIESISSTIKLDDLTGLVRIESVSGNITGTGLTGGAHIESTSGTISITDAAGDISVENTSGIIALAGIRSRVVRAESISGDIRFQGDVESDGRYEFSAFSGNVRLTLPASTGATLTLSTYSGGITSDFPITLQQGTSAGKDKQLQFRFGSGSARITAESFSGNIFINRGTGRDRQE